MWVVKDQIKKSTEECGQYDPNFVKKKKKHINRGKRLKRCHLNC